MFWPKEYIFVNIFEWFFMDQVQAFTIGLIVCHNVLGDTASNVWHPVRSTGP